MNSSQYLPPRAGEPVAVVPVERVLERAEVYFLVRTRFPCDVYIHQALDWRA
jgi:hypothetical protein